MYFLFIKNFHNTRLASIITTIPISCNSRVLSQNICVQPNKASMNKLIINNSNPRPTFAGLNSEENGSSQVPTLIIRLVTNINDK